MSRHVVFIASPLEPQHIETIAAVDRNRLEVLWEPDLLGTPRYVADHKGGPVKATPERAARWLACLARAEILFDLPPLDRCGRGILVEAPHLRWVQTTSTGVGQLIHLHGLQDSDILVTTARGVHAGPLAEFVMLGLLAHFRGLRHLEAEQRAHRWVRYCGEEVAGKRLLIIGAGDLARGTAHLARAFGMAVEAVTRRPDAARAHGGLFDAVAAPERLLERLPEADAVVVTVPHTPQTEGMIGPEAFAAMKPGCAFVNIARGQVVDEAALIAGLRSGRVGFAALDVAAREPLPADSPLWDMENVLISPHSASTVTAENARIADIFCHNLRLYLAGETSGMRNVLDKRRMY